MLPSHLHLSEVPTSAEGTWSHSESLLRQAETLAVCSDLFVCRGCLFGAAACLYVMSDMLSGVDGCVYTPGSGVDKALFVEKIIARLVS